MYFSEFAENPPKNKGSAEGTRSRPLEGTDNIHDDHPLVIPVLRTHKSDFFPLLLLLLLTKATLRLKSRDPIHHPQDGRLHKCSRNQYKKM